MLSNLNLNPNMNLSPCKSLVRNLVAETGTSASEPLHTESNCFMSINYGLSLLGSLSIGYKYITSRIYLLSISYEFSYYEAYVTTLFKSYGPAHYISTTFLCYRYYVSTCRENDVFMCRGRSNIFNIHRKPHCR